MTIKRSLLCLLVSAFLALGSCGSGGGSAGRAPSVIEKSQPYLDEDTWAWVAPIDGAGYCGPASLYHIIAYYGDTGHYDWQTPQGNWSDTRLHIPEINGENPLFIDATAFARFIQPNPGLGSGWIDLNKVTDLYRSKNILDRMYLAFACTSRTETDDIATRERRLSYIREHLLEQGFPVVVHLESAIPFYGHYIALIGYSPEHREIYYVDSLKHDSGIQTVPVEDFLGDWFYTGGFLYTARWDGEWMAFWDAELGTVCDRCGD